MTLVNTETGELIHGEIVHDLNAHQARSLTNEIRQTLSVGHDLIVEAFRGRAWLALGYPSWDAYCSGEFAEARMLRLDRDQRQEIVAEMKREGMSNRAIASGIGADYKTVMRDAQLVQDVPVEITGLDGKRRPNVPPVNAGTRQPSQVPASPTTGGQPTKPPLTERNFQEAELVTAFRVSVRPLLKPKNVSTLSPRARGLLIDLLQEAIDTLKGADE